MALSLRHLTCLSFLLLSISAHATVVRLEVASRTAVAKSDYEIISGKLHFEIDPKLPQNAIIGDVGLAPVNAEGKVSFTADLRLWKPKEDSRSNGAVWVEIPNRGGRAKFEEPRSESFFTISSWSDWSSRTTPRRLSDLT